MVNQTVDLAASNPGSRRKVIGLMELSVCNHLLIIKNARDEDLFDRENNQHKLKLKDVSKCVQSLKNGDENNEAKHEMRTKIQNQIEQSSKDKCSR